MITVCQFYTDFKGAANTWQGGHFRPQSFEYALHESQLEILNEMCDEYEKSQILTDDLRAFITSVQVPIKNFASGGIIPYPNDYRMFSSLRYFSKKENGKGCLCKDIKMMNEKKEGEDGCRELTEEEKAIAINSESLCENEITKVENQKWGAVCSHEFVGPSLEDRYCTQLKDGFKAVPKGIGYVVLDYIALPVRPKFIYTKDPITHEIICDLKKCVNLLWGEEMLPKLMSLVKQKYAFYTRNPEMYNQSKEEAKSAAG